MESVEASRHRKREFVVIKHGSSFYYARASRQDPDMYVVMTKVSQGEGKEIVARANEQSDMNRAIDDLIETGMKFQQNWKKDDEDEEVSPNGSNSPI